ncbi:hypothetical protein BV25DRAFT_1827263, partial [Artomyces pyxidatus]
EQFHPARATYPTSPPGPRNVVRGDGCVVLHARRTLTHSSSRHVPRTPPTTFPNPCHPGQACSACASLPHKHIVLDIPAQESSRALKLSENRMSGFLVMSRLIAASLRAQRFVLSCASAYISQQVVH